MVMALTKFVAHGVEPDEPLFKRYRQFAFLTITGANTDVDYDFGDSAGTFWTAVGASAVGLVAQAAIADINIRARAFLAAQGAVLQTRALADASRSVLTKLTGTVPAGSATPTAAVSGLLTTDTVVHATQQTKGANNLPLIGHANTCAVADQLALVYSADPGANGTINVSVLRTNTSPEAGTYQLTMGAQYTKVPNILFNSGDAPTTMEICLCWELSDDEAPVEAVKAA